MHVGGRIVFIWLDTISSVTVEIDEDSSVTVERICFDEDSSVTTEIDVEIMERSEPDCAWRAGKTGCSAQWKGVSNRNMEVRAELSERCCLGALGLRCGPCRLWVFADPKGVRRSRATLWNDFLLNEIESTFFHNVRIIASLLKQKKWRVILS